MKWFKIIFSKSFRVLFDVIDFITDKKNFDFLSIINNIVRYVEGKHEKKGQGKIKKKEAIERLNIAIDNFSEEIKEDIKHLTQSWIINFFIELSVAWMNLKKNRRDKK